MTKLADLKPLYDEISQKLPWLAYDDFNEFCFGAVRNRLEQLLAIAH